MKKILGTVLSFSLLGSAALAADLPVKAPPMPMIAAPATWTGFYLGLEGGYGWSESDLLVTTPSGGNFVTGDRLGGRSASGILIGLVAGADYQFGPWVLGIKGSYNWADITGDGRDVSTVFPGRDIFTNEKLDRLAMVTGRAGYTVTPDVLLYLNGGWAWAEREVDSRTVLRASNTIIATTVGSSRLDGWTIGAGLEWRLARNFSFVVQYNYIDFGTFAVLNNINSGPTAGTVVGREVSATLNTIKGGVNYRF